MKHLFTVTSFIILLFISVGSFAQFNVLKKATRKIERKLEDKADDAIDDAIDDAFGDGDNDNNQNNYPNTQGNPSTYPTSGNNPGGTQGAMKMSGPDVMANINDAQSSFSSKNYSDTRFAVQQALIGLEFELGKEVLKSLPTSISGMNYNESEDQVSSTSWGFVGLAIRRNYSSGNNTGEVSIMNNSGLLASYNMILSNPMYTSSTDNNYKVVKINSYRAVIEAKDNGHFNVGIPFGQSSVFILDLYGFNSEDQVMSIAKQFDIDRIKQILGEQ